MKKHRKGIELLQRHDFGQYIRIVNFSVNFCKTFQKTAETMATIGLKNTLYIYTIVQNYEKQGITMSNWLSKILIKAKESFNLEDKDVQKIEKEVGAVEMTSVKNTADAKILNKNNGNVPLAGSWGNAPPGGELEGFTLFKTSEQQAKNQSLTANSTNFVEIQQKQQQVELRVNTMAQQVSEQNKINAQQQNEQTAKADKQNKLPPFVESITYEEGKAIIKLKNGQTKTRLAAKGEPGYVKDGESIEERLTRFYGEKNFKEADTKEKKAELLRRYFEDYYKNMDMDQASKEKLQAQDYMKLMKNSGMDSEYSNIMGATLHSLYDKNKVKAYQGGIEQTRTQEQALNFTQGVVENIGLSGKNADVQQELISETATTAKQYNFRPEYVKTLASSFTFLNPANARFGADIAYQVHPQTANTQFESLLKKSENIASVPKDNADLIQAVKARLGDNYSIKSMDENGINACCDNICETIAIGDINGAAELVEKNKLYFSDVQYEAISASSRDYATNKEAPVEQRQRAAILTSDAAVRIDDADTQLEVVTQNVHAIAGTDEEVKKSYLEQSGKNAGKMNDSVELKADEMHREIDNEEQTYNMGVSEFGSTFAVENQKAIVQRTIDSGNEEAINNIAEHAYEYDLSNREDVIKMLKEKGYDSTMKALDEAKAKYESETVQKSEKTTDKSTEKTTEKDSATTTKTSETSGQKSSSADSKNSKSSAAQNKKIEDIISNSATNVSQKAKQIKGLTSKEQDKAIIQLMANASIPEIKGYILSGLKSEVIGFLLNNFNTDNKTKLDSVKYLMSQKEVAQYDELVEERKDKINFFLT